MKKLFFTIMVCILGIYTAAAVTISGKRILIVYYSRTGNTETIAKFIQKKTGGELFRVETVMPYPENYRATTEQAKKEINEGYKPPIKTKVKNIKDYDIVFVGSPSWWATIAPPISTFLSEHDLSGKTVIPFVTHGGSGLGNNVENTAKLAPRATVRDAEAFRGASVSNAQNDVNKWLDRVFGKK